MVVHPNENSAQNDQSLGANILTDQGDLSSIVTTSENDMDENGVRDVVEDAIKMSIPEQDRRQVVLSTAKTMQMIIDQHSNSSQNFQSHIDEYNRKIECLAILNKDGHRDVSFLTIVMLASSNNVDSFEALTDSNSTSFSALTIKDCQ